MRLTKNFSLEEMTASATAKRLGIDNSPKDRAIVLNLTVLCDKVLQPVRNRFGAVTVTSGYRCDELNAAIHGSKTSQHPKGEAADIKLRNMREAFNWIRENLEFDQLIWEYGNDNEPDWIHVSFSLSKNRKEVLRVDKVRGYYKI